MVSPEIVTLSVLSTPWTKPTSIHCATSRACAATTASKSARYGACAAPASGWCRSIATSASRRVSSMSPWAAASWKLPTRRWLLATRASTAPGSTVSRRTPRPVPTTASARVVGIPRACMASLTTYSRSIGPTAARPSPPRANGVRPEPLRCRSRSPPSRSTSSPRRRALPSPSRGLKPPNWCPAYACATGRAPGGTTVPVSRPRPSGPRSASTSSPSSTASGSFSTSSSGAGVGSACHGRASSGTARANRSSRARVRSGAERTSRGYVAEPQSPDETELRSTPLLVDLAEVLVVAVRLGLALEGGVADVEVLGRAVRQPVQDAADAVIVDRLLGDGHVGGEARHPAGDRPGVQVVDVDDAGHLQQVPAYVAEIHAGRGDLQQDGRRLLEQDQRPRQD